MSVGLETKGTLLSGMVRGKAERGRAIEKYSKVGSGEVAQWLRELATLQRTCVGLIPSTPTMAHKHL